jgi:myo-inositol-1(or 4)-monophosphatase
MGSAALDLAYVAAGRFDGFWEAGLAPWDIAAGMLMVREAGGFVEDLGGRENVLATGDILATNAHLLGPLGRVLRHAAKLSPES